jgi:hypothetical protein
VSQLVTLTQEYDIYANTARRSVRSSALDRSLMANFLCDIENLSILST